jgi:toxin ParE1/3/4
MTQLVVTTDAEADTFAVLPDLEAKAGAPVAERYARRFVLQSNASSRCRRAAHPRPALGADTRCVIVPPYLLIYDYALGENTVVLLRVLHGRRRITRETTQRG